MTTRVLFVNYGPKAVNVVTMGKAVQIDGLPPRQDLKAGETIVQPATEKSFYVYSHQYLTVREESI